MKASLAQDIQERFSQEITYSQLHKNTILRDQCGFLDNIYKLCDYIEHHKNIEQVFTLEEKRAIFDRASPSKSVELIWFICAYQDNVDLFKWACSGLSWLKGSEKTMTVIPLQKLIAEFKPIEITKWLLEKKHEDKDILFTSRIISPYLLYVVENQSKKLQHQLVKRSFFTSNSIETYKFLRQTKDEHLFDKVMTKHMNDFHFYVSNIILFESNKNNDLQFFSHFKNTTHSLDEQIIKLREMGLNNIAHYLNASHVSENLHNQLSSSSRPRSHKKI